MKDRKFILSAGVFAFVCNLLLFGVKLYVGLASGSISIYSDGINNFFDCLSGALTVGVIIALSKVNGEEGEKECPPQHQLYAEFDTGIGKFIGTEELFRQCAKTGNRPLHDLG
ncbi:MAG: cation transporter, partial [Clostridia bacterium]|nr:cation transporter [Clostridia bacterium]